MTPAAPLSRAEQTAFEETSRYEDVRSFIEALSRQTPRVRVEMFGRSEEGRDLPLLIVGDPPAVSPVPHSLPVVFVMANIHAGEVEGKEAVLHLARRLTLGDLQPLSRSAVWLFAPIYNADGNERFSLDNRSEQNGPIGGVGTRENAKGLDLNRDFMKLESSEARALVALFTRWDPDVIVDLHTTNGSYHGYHLTYAPPLSPNTDSRIDAFARTRLLPAVREAMSARGWRTFDYGNFSTVESIEEELEGFAPGESRRKVWRTFDPRPRFGHTYSGLRNRVAILSEAYSYLDFERRVQVTEAFVEEIMRFVAGNADDIRSLGASVDAEWASGAAPREEGIAFALRPLPEPVDILVADVGTKVNTRSGKPMKTMLEQCRDAGEHDSLRPVHDDRNASRAPRVSDAAIRQRPAPLRGTPAERARDRRGGTGGSSTRRGRSIRHRAGGPRPACVPGPSRNGGHGPFRAKRSGDACRVDRRADQSGPRAAGLLSAGTGEQRWVDDVECVRRGARGR